MSKPDYMKYDGRKPEPPYETNAAPQVSSGRQIPERDSGARPAVAAPDHAEAAWRVREAIEHLALFVERRPSYPDNAVMMHADGNDMIRMGHLRALSAYLALLEERKPEPSPYEVALRCAEICDAESKRMGLDMPRAAVAKCARLVRTYAETLK